MTLKDVTEKFLDKYRKSGDALDKKIMYVQLLESTKGSFCNAIGTKYDSENPDADDIRFAIKESVKSYSSDKDKLIEAYKKYIDFINKETGWDIEINDYPPIPIYDSFERRMFILKYLQSPESKKIGNDSVVQRLSEILWVSERTLERDISKLRDADSPLKILGKKFVVPETKRFRGLFEMSSTVHPFLLTCNLTQVITILKGLKKMSEIPGFEIYAMTSAIDIWNQLSDYAKNRIKYVCENLIAEDIQWYKSLDEDNEFMFKTEYQCRSSYGAGIVLDCLKNGKSCKVEYIVDDKSEFIEVSKVNRYDVNNRKLIVLEDEKEVELDINKILRSAYINEELI